MISSLFQFEFLRNAFLTGMIIGVLAPLLGTFIVCKTSFFNYRCVKSRDR